MMINLAFTKDELSFIKEAIFDKYIDLVEKIEDAEGDAIPQFMRTSQHSEKMTEQSVDALKSAGFWKSKSVIEEAPKKPHWTQTPEGKKKIAARKKRGWKK